MSTIHANYESVALTGTMNFATGKETGFITATTIHQIVCLGAGTIVITPMAGPSFSWAPTVIGTTINVMVKSITVSSGTFIGFKAKHIPPQGRGSSGGWEK